MTPNSPVIKEGNTPCPGCGALVSSSPGPTHAYIGASPGCWATYGMVLAREYSDPRYFRVHRVTVDAYAAQHPGQASRRSIQSVAVHLIGLYAVLQLGHNNRRATEAVRKAADSSDRFVWLEPPDSRGTVTVLDVAAALNPAEHQSVVLRWAHSIWDSWKANHQTVQRWAGN